MPLRMIVLKRRMLCQNDLFNMIFDETNDNSIVYDSKNFNEQLERLRFRQITNITW